MEMNSFQNHSMIYRIVNFIEETGQIEIECKGYPGRIAIDLPVEDGKYPEGDQLDNYIRGFVPTWLIERYEKINNGISNADTLRVFNGSENKPNDVIQEKERIYTITERRGYRKMRLMQSDWTQLPDAPLTEVEKLAWKEYRQKLRDLVFDPDDNTTFPEPPNKLNVVIFDK
jgi:hypothetical protein